MLIALVAVMALFQLLITTGGNGSLLSAQNITNLINQNAYVIILAVGMLLCILTGGNIDLAIGSIVCLVGAAAGILIVTLGMNIYVAIVICLLFGTLLGAWQAYWIAYIRIPAFIVTLSGMLLFRGLGNLLLNGVTISPFPANYSRLFSSYIPTVSAGAFVVSLVVGLLAIGIYLFIEISSRNKKVKKGYDCEALSSMIVRMVFISAVILWFFNKLGQYKGIPVILVWVLVIVLSYNYFTSSTVQGRHFYAMGGNEKAAILSGINTNKVLFIAYTNMGFLAAISALVVASRFNSATPSAGTGFELDAIGACFIGGASAYGGSGTIGGCVIGAILMGVLNNGMSLLGIDANWQKAVKGLVLLAAVVFDIMSKKRAAKK
ncbi:MAG: sugar ABC transporter permease [Spirochaetaceae bacterium]|nr:sugar ABC transporter permease [Spirochaetaceae bacterium]